MSPAGGEQTAEPPFPPPASEPRPPAPPSGWVPPAGPAHGPPSGWIPPSGYPPPPGYGMPIYASPAPGFYPGPNDPLVSPDFGGWWQRSFALLKTAWRPMLIVQSIWIVPLLIATICLNYFIGNKMDTILVTSVDTIDINWNDLLVPMVAIVPLYLVALLLSLLVSLATLQIVVQAATGRPLSVADALSTAVGRAPALLGWGFVATLAILAGTLLCILPGIYVAVVMMILTPVVLLERGVGVGRCFQLVHADFGAAIARLATIAGLSLGLGLVESAVNNVLATAFTTGNLNAAGAVISALISIAFTTATAVAFAPMYLTAYADMRARREPFSTAYLA